MGFETTVKEWFKDGLKPTQAQFWAKFSFLRWKDEKIPITDIDQIEDILNAKAEAAVVTNHLTSATAHATEFNAKEDKANKGEANGYVPLNELVKIASQYLNIVDDVVTGGSSSLLSAEQGKVLKTQIDAINLLLTSDNVNLDNVQELVDAIETLQTSLETILVNDLTTGGTTKALTAEQGKVLKGLIDQLWAMPINIQNGSTYTFQATDANKLVIANYTYGLTATIPNNASVPFPVGTTLNAYSRGDNILGMTIAAASSVTILNSDLVFLPKTHLQLRKIDTNTWYISKTQENFVKLRVNTDNGVFSKSGGIHYIDGNDFDSYEIGDTFFRKGNFFLKGRNNGSGLATRSFGSSNSDIPRNMVGLGLDATMQPCNFNLGLDYTAYGMTSLALTGYEYHNTLADRGYTNVHPDMAAGALFNFIGNFGEDAQMYVDCRGQLFVKGGSGYGGNNGAWKKITNSESGSFVPTSVGGVVFSTCYWQKIGSILTCTLRGTANQLSNAAVEVSLPNGFAFPSPVNGRVLGTGIASVPTPYVQNGDVVVSEYTTNSLVKLTVKTPSAVEDYSFSVTFSIQIN